MATRKKKLRPHTPAKRSYVRTPVHSALATYVSSVFPVVAVGSSAGGLDPLNELLRALPADCGMALILIQHHDPKSLTALPQILGRATKIPVRMAADGDEVAPNTIYVAPA